MFLTVALLASASKIPWPFSLSAFCTKRTAGMTKAGDSASCSSRKLGLTTSTPSKSSGLSAAACKPEIVPILLHTSVTRSAWATSVAKSASCSDHVKKLYADPSGWRCSTGTRERTPPRAVPSSATGGGTRTRPFSPFRAAASGPHPSGLSEYPHPSKSIANTRQPASANAPMLFRQWSALTKRPWTRRTHGPSFVAPAD
mmetsp:Transcript_7805/g.25926  ORF Transcript_7805/g.25926 Transcript_7805/m.25926 type:complete len:200 (-) Transcript_7805:38-637(-)